MITKNYLIEKALKDGKKIRQICKIYKYSPNKVIKIKKEGFLRINKLKELLYEIRENNPFFKLKDFQNYLKEHYTIKSALSKIYYKLKKKLLDDKTARLIEMLIEDKKFYEIKKIIKFYKFESKHFYLLERIPDDYLDEDNFVGKVIMLSENFKLTNDEKRNYLKKVDEINKYSFYILLELKVVKQIYQNYINEIEKLPKENKLNLYFSIANVQAQYPEISFPILRKLSKFKLKDENLKEVMRVLFSNMGYIYKSKQYLYNLDFEFSTGNITI